MMMECSKSYMLIAVVFAYGRVVIEKENWAIPRKGFPAWHDTSSRALSVPSSLHHPYITSHLLLDKRIERRTYSVFPHQSVETLCVYNHNHR